MSTVTPPAWLGGLAIEPATAESLRRFAARRRLLLLARGLAAGVAVFLAAMAVIVLCDYLWLLPQAARWALGLAGYAAALAAAWWFGWRGAAVCDPRTLARQLESIEPRLRQQLLAAVELGDPQLENGSPALRRRLQRRVAQRMATLDPKRLLPLALIRRWVSGAVAMAIVALLLLLIPELQFGRRMARAMLPGAAIQRASLTKLSIIHPTPASGVVAQGDSVGVVAAVDGKPADTVSLRFYSTDGVMHQRPMTSRQTGTQAEPPGRERTYAANLPVGSAPVEYQVLAGDAATLWHTLTPRPRPRVASFEKHYRYPSYTRLDDHVTVADHGDLEALAGTLAKVTVRFDQPVRDAVLRYSSHSDGVPLEPVGKSSRRFVASIPIRMPAQYQIDAIGIRSGLNNPFSPQHRITPVPDRPPDVEWSKELAPTTLVSPLEVLSLTATVRDDLPVERVIQEYQVNGGAWKQRPVRLDEPGRELSLRWSWDLMHPGGGSGPPLELSAGDTLRSRVVAVDRRASRGISPTIEFLVADPEFDRQRHRRLQHRREWTLTLTPWLDRAGKLAERIGTVVELAEQEPRSAAEALIDEIESFARAVQASAEQAEQLRERSGALLEGAETAIESNGLERLARAADDLDRRLRRIADQMRAWSAQLGELPADKGRELIGRWKRESGEIASAAQRTRSSARAWHAHRLAAGMLSDLVAVIETVQPLVDEPSDVPASRLPRYAHLVAGQLQAIDELVKQHEAAVPDSTRRQHARWLSSSDDWKERLRGAIAEAPGEAQWRSLFRRLATELDEYSRQEVQDGRVAAQLRQAVRRLPPQLGWFRDRLERLRELGQRHEQLREQAAASGDSAAARLLGHQAKFAGELFALDARLLEERLRHTESLLRRRRAVDLHYAADLNLLQRALEQVTAEGFRPFRDEPPEAVMANLAEAFHLLETTHAASQWLGELGELVQAERYLETRVAAEVEHPLWIDRIDEGLAAAADALRSSGVEAEIIATLEQIPSSDRFQQASQQITSRRYAGAEPLPADSLLTPAVDRFSEALRRLDEPTEAARDVIRRYLATLPEQARRAAEEAEQARERTDDRQDATAATAEELIEKQRAVQRAVNATLRSLADKANTADLSDPQQRQLARDADAAAATIRAEARRLDGAIAETEAAEAEQAREQALEHTEEALDDLAGTLRQTAEHFDRAARGEPLEPSRQALRQDVPDGASADPLQQAREAAEQLAEDAQQSPEALMEQLERELETNRPMRHELDDIAQRSAGLAQRTVDQAAQEQRALSESLERSDPAFRERKELVRQRLVALAQRVTEVEQALLDAAQRAVGWANDPELRPQIEQARERLRETAERARALHPDRALLHEVQAASAEIEQAVREARETAEAVAQRSARLAQQDIHQDPQRRDRSEQQMNQIQRESRNRRARAIAEQRKHWSDVQRDAGRRIQQAQRRQRDAEQARRRAEEQGKQQSEDAAAQRKLAVAQQQLQEAQQAIEAARATRQFAGQRADAAAERQEQFKQSELAELDKPNPASQLAERLSEEARGELEQIAAGLQQLGRDARFEDRLRVPSEQAEQLADRQQQIHQRVERAAEHLRRAGRHQQRLGQQDTAEQLGKAAASLEQNAREQAQRALDSLKSAAQSGEQSPEAARQVRRATEQFRQQADALAEMLGTPRAEDRSSDQKSDQQQMAESDQPEERSPQEVTERSDGPAEPADDAPPRDGKSTQNQSGSGQPEAQRRSGRDLARMLDELDRSMHASPGGENDPRPGESPDGQPPGRPTAGESSPTLDSALQQQLQRAARRRGRENRAASSASTVAGSAGPHTGKGEQPAAGESALDPERLLGDGSQWGQLRQQRTEDVVEGAAVEVPSQYRHEIEAYFQAVAERAAERFEGAEP